MSIFKDFRTFTVEKMFWLRYLQNIRPIFSTFILISYHRSDNAAILLNGSNYFFTNSLKAGQNGRFDGRNEWLILRTKLHCSLWTDILIFVNLKTNRLNTKCKSVPRINLVELSVSLLRKKTTCIPVVKS